MKGLADEIEFKKGGLIEHRANEVLSQAYRLLERIRQDGLFISLENGVFAGTKRAMDGGKGLEGVVEKDEGYFNPFIDLFNRRKAL